MLLITGMGILASVVLICSIILFSQVAMTAGLRNVLNTAPDRSEIAIDVNPAGVSTQLAGAINGQIDGLTRQSLGKYLNGPPQFSIQTHKFSFISNAYALTASSIVFSGATMDEAARHLRLVQGRLPLACSSSSCPYPIEVAITPETASVMHATIGSTYTFQVAFFAQPPTVAFTNPLQQNLQVRVVGLFTPTQNDLYWHGIDFAPTGVPQTSPPEDTFSMLVSNDDFLAAFSRLARQNKTDGVYNSAVTDLYWYYQLNTPHLTANDLDGLIAQLDAIQAHLSDRYPSSSWPNPAASYPYVLSATATGSAVGQFEVPSSLEKFRDRVVVARIPIAILAIQIIALVLLFISVMAELLVERQAEAIAIMRSRGASRAQIFGVLMTQGVTLGVIALVAGPLLALPTVYFVAQRVLAPANQGALNVITSAPLQVALGLRWYALVATLVALITMGLALYRAAGFDVLALRREVARPVQRPLWRRLNLDLVAAIIALASYALSLYVTGFSGLDVSSDTLVATPIALIGPLFLIVAGILLFLRLFPSLLRLGARFATRGRGAEPLLALGQMSRAPRQSVRVTLLLALATAFAIFSLIFIASQMQRTLDTAAFQVGADFSGQTTPAMSVRPLSDVQAAYGSIPGVISATPGYAVRAASASASYPIGFEVRAVNANTYARTAIWTAQDSTQSLSSLMQLLIVRRSSVAASNALPAIIDAEAASSLHLSIGSRFALNEQNRTTNSGSISYIVVAEVQHIPTINDSTDSGATADYTPPCGVLVDYQSYATIYQQDFAAIPPINTVWLRTRDDAASLTSVHAALTSATLQLSQLEDRRAILASMHSDPLYLDLIGVLSIGATATLLLAVIGTLLASWSNARTRLVNFAVLRALGTTTRQVAQVLTWEQGTIYTIAIALGAIFGTLLCATAVPSLIYTSSPLNGVVAQASAGEFYVIQRVLPIHTIIPVSLLITLALLVLICGVSLGMMVRTVSQPALSQTLRLNED
jgi:putative ABC transport system permease protein